MAWLGGLSVDGVAGLGCLGWESRAEVAWLGCLGPGLAWTSLGHTKAGLGLSEAVVSILVAGCNI